MEKQAIIKEIEKFLNSQTPNSRRSNRKLVGLADGLKAAQVVNGKFWPTYKDQAGAQKYLDLEAEFFLAYEKGLGQMLHEARDWKL